MKKVIFGALVLALLAGCTSKNDAERALIGAGYHDVQITGYRFYGCAENDTYHTGFRAIGPSGVAVEGVVCSSFLKGATIRFD